MNYYFKTDSGNFRSGDINDYNVCQEYAEDACLRYHEIVRVFSISDGVSDMEGYWMYLDEGKTVYIEGCFLDPKEVWRQYDLRRKRKTDEVFIA